MSTLLDNIHQAPIAAMTLVQVLRATEQIPAAQALTVESLAYSTLQSGADFRRWAVAHPPQPQRILPDDAPPLLIERRGGTLEIRLNRPSSRNAMSIEMRDALVEAFELAVIDDGITVGALSLIRNRCAAFGIYFGSQAKRLRERAGTSLISKKSCSAQTSNAPTFFTTLSYFSQTTMKKPIYLNVGCGTVMLPDFVNIDRDTECDLRCDVTQGLPFQNNEVDGIYSEHFIEHLSQTDGVGFLRECRRILKRGGIIRIATPPGS